ncbi:MAG TPA: hypothetical protein VK901_05080 [Nitrospiraceae bacterium]|nr:hypothetical protein [Nitrospiraceae bacterium]
MRHHILLTRPTPSQICLGLFMMAISILGARQNATADESLPSSTPDFPSLVRAHSDQLAKIESDKEAGNLFVSTIGPALQMREVARTLGANPLPATLANELLVPDLKAAVHRLMGSLAVLHLASTVRQAIRDRQLSTIPGELIGSPQARAWLDQQDEAPWHDSLSQMSDVLTSPEWAKGDQEGLLEVTTLERAAHLEVDALQSSYQEWDRIRSWKDRVRGLRGQARLCGTWQWIIHNHQQNHREQKLTLLFPPAGNTQTTLHGLVETIVLGENVYLRWEVDGRVQEDSLQFSKEGQRLEGTFVNSQGGWGSISGKRAAGCIS